MVRPNTATPRQLGVLHHYALETLDIQKVYATVVDRGYKPPQSPISRATAAGFCNVTIRTTRGRR